MAASSCSQTNPPPPPAIRTVYLTPTLPPEAREECPKLSAKPPGDMPQQQVFDNWAADRTARNICEERRKAAVAAVDAPKTHQGNAAK
ncbi:hypothetical protein RMR16_008735 [Agrobacterium sp. rho-13.3]|uniref:hypothetical protein n=1 Tax=Agrobacterium sp. rho-13.3 TaxID=3072980 RepID=UPI002A15109E|nr:hypothetical protein [Agrobacterium sp. rho-13.3]MDX8310036.1 hypothetical protein [Agrobacterium sp. rho-13.3]